MRIPFFAPAEFGYMKQLNTSQEVFNALISKPIEHVVVFFEVALDDETWTKEIGGELITALLDWFNREFINRHLSLDHLNRIATKFQEQSAILQDFMDFDIQFEIDTQLIPASSLLFGAASEIFREMIWKNVKDEKKKIIVLRKINLLEFNYFNEFIRTGSIANLWKQESTAILSLLRLASTWRVDRLANFAAFIFKRYLSEENILDYLAMSERDSLPALQNECCDYINKQNYGLNVVSKAFLELGVEIFRWTEKGNEILISLLPSIMSISCSSPAIEEQNFVDLIKRKKRFYELNLQFSKSVPFQLLDFFPDVHRLNLSYCSWLDDTNMIKILEKSPSLKQLKVIEDLSLTYRSWSALSLVSDLISLDLSDCRQITDDEIDLIATNCPKLEELRLSGCFEIEDKGFWSVGKHCKQLTSLDISRCQRLTEEGMVELVGLTTQIAVLNLSSCRAINDQVVITITKLLRSLKELDIQNCHVSEVVLNHIQKTHPRLQLKK